MSTAKQNATGGPMTNQLVSFYDIAKPQISNIVFYKFRYILPMNVLKTLGLTAPVAGEYAEHFEAAWIHPNFHSDETTTAGGAGQNLTFRLSPNDITDPTGASRIYPRITDTVKFKNGYGGQITNIIKNSGSDYDIVVTPTDPAVTLTISSGDAVWIIANSQVEGSVAPGPRTSAGKEKYRFPLQTIREEWTATGSALTDELWFNRDQFGNMRDTYNSGYLDGEYRFWEQVGNAMIWNPTNTNTSALSTYPYMYSMDYVTTTQGNDVGYTGAYTMNDIKENVRYAKKLATGRQFWVLEGPEFSMSINDGASNVFSQNPNLFFETGASQYSSIFTQGEEDMAQKKGVSITFRKICYDSYEFHLCPVDQWGIEVGGGAAGFTQTGTAFFIPLQKSQDAEGTERDRIQMRYKKLGKFDRSAKIWELGANANVPTSSEDVLQVNWLANWGGQYFGAEHFQKASPDSLA